MASSSGSLPVKISSNTTYIWCDTDMIECKFAYIWTIKKFTQLPEVTGEYIDSSTFSASEEDKWKWHLRLHPRDGTRKADVSLYLCHVPDENQSIVTPSFECYILNYKRQKCNVKKERNHTFRTGARVFGFQGYISRDELMDENNKLLQNDQLIVCCEVTVFAKPSNTDGRYNPIRVKDSVSRLTEDLERLLESRICSDVVLVAEKKELHVHKAVLVARSSVFAAMFDHDTEENQQNRVLIPDITHKILQDMIRFMYNGKVPDMDEEMTIQLLAAADKYALEDLKLICEQSLSINLTSGKVANLIPIASMHSANYLKSQIIEFMKSRATDDAINVLWMDMIDEHPEIVARPFENTTPTELLNVFQTAELLLQ